MSKYEVLTESRFQKFLDEPPIAVICEIEELANEFLKRLDSLGMKWGGGDKYTTKNNWDVYENKTCYYSDGEYSNIGFAKAEGYIIYNFKGFCKMETLELELQMLKEQEAKIKANIKNIEIQIEKLKNEK